MEIYKYFPSYLSSLFLHRIPMECLSEKKLSLMPDNRNDPQSFKIYHLSKRDKYENALLMTGN